MTTEQIAYLALLVAIISLMINFVTLLRDRHRVIVRGSIYESASNKGTWNLSITAANKGKRPISVSFVTIRPKGQPGLSMLFGQAGSVLVDIGGSATMNIEGKDGAGFWKTTEEIKRSKITVQDALGKDHAVKL